MADATETPEQELVAAETALTQAQTDIAAQQAADAAQPPAGPVTADTVNATVDAWFADTMQRPPLSWNTDSYSQAVAARDTLKAQLAALFNPTAATAAPATE